MEQLLDNIREYIPSYRGVSFDQLTLTKYNSTTNQVFKVEAPTEPSPIIYRIFGEVPLIPKALERKNFIKVSNAGLGPRCLGVQDTYRLEEYINGTALPRLELSDRANDMAHVLAEFHKLETANGESSSSKLIKI